LRRKKAGGWDTKGGRKIIPPEKWEKGRRKYKKNTKKKGSPGGERRFQERGRPEKKKCFANGKGKKKGKKTG